ncbi:MAG: sulfite exporter TauE/SafE family protein [Candidatus Coatesbacteria bacterium]|nr:sulfite exporter TauE/SafE family protein [Candidatus Coatesbacteria bacterium]
MSYWAFLAEGFTLGISLGMTCLATCGPVYLPYIMSSRNEAAKSLLIVLYITLGRFVSYLFFGLIAGIIGKHISEISRTSFTSIAYIGLSLLLIYQAIIKGRIRHEKCEINRWQKGLMNPFLLGVLTGINFCPAFLIALTRLFYISGIIGSVLLFL